MTRFINVRVIPKAKKNDVVKTDSGLKVYLTAPPQEGKANKALLEILAERLHLRKSDLSIIKGKKSKDKIIRIETN